MALADAYSREGLAGRGRFDFAGEESGDAVGQREEVIGLQILRRNEFVAIENEERMARGRRNPFASTVIGTDNQVMEFAWMRNEALPHRAVRPWRATNEEPTDRDRAHLRYHIDDTD